MPSNKTSGNPKSSPDGSSNGIGSLLDNRKQEEAILKREETYRHLIETTDTGYVIIDNNGCVLDANQEYIRLSGHGTLDEILGRSVVEWTADEEKETNAQAVAMCIKNGFFKNLEITYIDIKGKRTSVEINATVMRTEKKQKILALCRDISQRRNAEYQRQAAADVLRLRESYLSAIIENQPGLLWLKDRDGKFLTVNSQFSNSCGLDTPESLIGKTDFDIWPHDLAVGYIADDAKVMETGKPCMVEEHISDKGEIRWFETFKTPIFNKQGIIIGTTGYSRDITERKRIEEELQRAQKLDSLGVLAGGIAHDFNNLLAGIYGNIDLARSISKDAQAIEYLNATLSTMNRARALTLQLLTFSKGGAPVQKSTLLIPFVCDAVRFALSGSNISSRFSLPENLWPCNIDKNQIIQVIENIVINAQQAMPNGGEIEISAMNVEASDYPRKAKGNYVKVSIKDFGIGIPKDIMPRIFDPFYTTKTKGHGLGLATCYSIINRHGGCIEVESEPGKGSAFHVYLPASMLPVVADERICVDNGGAGAIIVVDDEEVIRITVKRMLELKGYTAICKNDGKEAIDFFIRETKEHHRFAAMIFDLTIPGGMGGVDAVREIRAIDKEIPVFVASGYADNSVMKNPIEYGFTASICKPFTIAELSEMLGNYIKKGHPVK